MQKLRHKGQINIVDSVNIDEAGLSFRAICPHNFALGDKVSFKRRSFVVSLIEDNRNNDTVNVTCITFHGP